MTRSSSLQVVPQGSPTSSGGSSNYYHGSFSDSEMFSKKVKYDKYLKRIEIKHIHWLQELAGRTMDFSFDISQTPLIGRRILLKSETGATQGGRNEHQHVGTLGSPRRSASLSPADAAQMSGWKRPWMSQGRVRECLVSLLTTCGQRVGLPKSPSVSWLFAIKRFVYSMHLHDSINHLTVSLGNNIFLLR